MYTFGNKDTYKISHFKRNDKFVIDYKLLVRLYSPIIGSIATSLFLVLESEISLSKNKTSNEIARLLKILQISNKQFNDAINTLKEYDLVTYKANAKKQNDFLFVIHNSKTATEFFNDKKFNDALKVIVDETYYQQVYDYFMSFVSNDDDEYVDIVEPLVKKEITEEEFYNNFYEKYPIIANATAISLKDKEEIRRLKNLFNLSYDEIEQAILNCFDYESEQMVIDLVKLNNFISNKYKNKIEDKEALIISSFENERSIAYYQKMTGRVNLLPRETSMITEILDKYKISEGVLNVVINYYFEYAKTKISNPINYFIKVIEEMIINNVSTTKDAMDYFRKRNKNISSSKENIEIKNKINNAIPSKKEDNISVDTDLANKFKEIMGG